jgi:hypothetical protein
VAASNRDKNQAEARYDEIDALLLPTKEYLDNMAKAQRDKAVALAQAAYQRAASGLSYGDAYSDGIESNYEATIAVYQQAYGALRGQAASAWYESHATFEHQAIGVWINAEASRTMAAAAAQAHFDRAANAWLVTATDLRNSLTETFSEQSHEGWLDALEAMATSHNSPWAAFEVRRQTAYIDEHLTAANDAQSVLHHGIAAEVMSELNGYATQVLQNQTLAAEQWALSRSAEAAVELNLAVAHASSLAIQAATHFPQLVLPIRPTSGQAAAQSISSFVRQAGEDRPSVEADLVKPADSLALGTMYSTLSVVAQSAFAVANYHNPAASILIAAAKGALPDVPATVVGSWAGQGEGEGGNPASMELIPGKKWDRKTVINILRALAVQFPELERFVAFMQNVDFKVSPFRLSWFTWLGRTGAFEDPSSSSTRRQEANQNVLSDQVSLGIVESVLVQLPANYDSLQVVLFLLQELDANSALSDAYLDFLMRSPSNEAMNDPTRDHRLQNAKAKLHDAAVAGLETIETVVSAVPGGNVVVLGFHLSERQWSQAAWDVVFLVPWGALAQRGVSVIRFTAKNGDEIALGVRQLQALDRLPPAERLKVAEAVAKAEDGTALVKALNSPGARMLPMIGDAAEQMCFTRDTLVATSGGQKPIGEVQAGELVWAFNFAIGDWVLAKVVQRHDNVYQGDLVTVHVGASKIEVTAHHPFWVVEGQDLEGRPTPRKLAVGEDTGQALPGRWVDSHELRPADVLLSSDGRCRRVQAVDVRFESTLAVSNLTLDDHHTFAVGAESLLVHNVNWCAYLREKIGGHPPGLINKLADLIETSGTNYVIHAHHIVMKTVPADVRGKWVKGSQEILKKANINLLATEQALKSATKDEIYNMCWAIKGSGPNGLHSEVYTKAVYEKLKQGFENNGRQGVIDALKNMARDLQNNYEFWKVTR